MNELQIILLLGSGPVCWMLGGKYWRPLRWLLWPLVAGGILLWSGTPWWRAGLVAFVTGAVNTLPYGEKTPWVVRILVFLSFPLPAAVLSLKVLAVFLPLAVFLLGALFWLSRKFNWVTHKIWEAAGGFVQAAAIVAGRLAG